jgi:hypothetical protein
MRAVKHAHAAELRLRRGRRDLLLRIDSFIHQSIALDVRILDVYFLGWMILAGSLLHRTFHGAQLKLSRIIRGARLKFT